MGQGAVFFVRTHTIFTLYWCLDGSAYSLCLLAICFSCVGTNFFQHFGICSQQPNAFQAVLSLQPGQLAACAAVAQPGIGCPSNSLATTAAYVAGAEAIGPIVTETLADAVYRWESKCALFGTGTRTVQNELVPNAGTVCKLVLNSSLFAKWDVVRDSWGCNTLFDAQALPKEAIPRHVFHGVSFPL